MESKTSDDVKTYIKVKKFESSEAEKPYYKISENKQTFSLYDPIRKAESEKTVTVNVDKIFTDEENSYIYETICRDTIIQASNGKNFCFLGYGVTETSKKSTMFGAVNCVDNINNRGLCFRMIENLINSNVGVSVSYLSIYGKQFIDLSNLIGKEKEDYDIDKLLSYYEEAKANTDIGNIIKKAPLTDLHSAMKFYTRILSLYKKVDMSSDRKICSRSSFIVILHLSDKKDGKPISTITFGTFAGSEKLMNIDPNDTKRARDSIYIQNSFANFIKILASMKSPDFKTDKLSELSFDENVFTACLKNYILNAKFRIIGCIYPNTGFHGNVKDTIMFLFKCRKTTLEKTHQETTTPEKARDEEIYKLHSDINARDKTISKLKEKIEELQNKLTKSNENFKKDLETVKTAFCFEGDIGKLVQNDDYTPEARYARNIRNSVDKVKYLNKRVAELEGKLNQQVEETKKIDMERRIIEADKNMVEIYTKMKEHYHHEENKLKINSEHAKELEKLRTENEKLKKKIDSFNSVIAEKNRHIDNLPGLLKDNITERKEYAKKKDDLKISMEKKLKANIDEVNANGQKANNVLKQKFDAVFRQKDDELYNLRDEFVEYKRTSEENLKKYFKEILHFYDNTITIVNTIKKIFDPKKLHTTLLNNPNFTILKEEMDKEFKPLYKNINRLTYPTIWEVLDNRVKEKSTSKTNLTLKKEEPINENNNTHEVKVNKSIPNNPAEISLDASEISEEVGKLKSKLPTYSQEDLAKYEKNDLLRFIEDYKKSNDELLSFVAKVKRNKRTGMETVKAVNGEDEYKRLCHELDRMRRKYEEMVKINNNNKILLESRDRVIERHTGQGFFSPKTQASTGANFRPSSTARPFSGFKK
jgi:peptidoglycan hydrolase CwlO-like protein